MTINHEDLIAEARSLGDRNFTLSVPDHAKAAFRALADAQESTTARLREAEAVIAKVRKRVAVLGETFEGLQQMPTSNLNGFAADLATYKPTNQEDTDA